MVNKRENEKNSFKDLTPEAPADFQTAIAATGFGKFNLLLLLIYIPATWTTQFESTLTSFIIPAAACDLNLTSSQKGLLNSMVFLGMVLSGFIWGVLLDTLGRKKMLFLGYVLESLVVLAKSFSQNFYFLLIFKFMGGALTGGIYIALNTYLQEFHATKYRGRIQMTYASMYCAANVTIPLMASVILPLNFHRQFFGYVDLHAWNLLILASSIASILSALAFYFLPESPKFLMTAGHNRQALNVFRKVYEINSGNSMESYPVKTLIEELEEKEESPEKKKSWLEYVKLGWKQISPLFGKNHGSKLLLVCVVQSIFQMVINTLRLYMPQIFQAIHEYQLTHNGSASNLCDILDDLRSPEPEEEFICTVNLNDSFRVYLNSIIIAAVTIVGYAMAGTLINIFGRKRLLNILGITATISVSCMYFSQNTIQTLALSSLFLATAGVCFDIFITIVVVIFPTTLRAMAFSICLLVGRALTVLGNMMFPILVDIGCAPPFFTLGCFVLFAILLACLIPNTDEVDMK